MSSSSNELRMYPRSSAPLKKRRRFSPSFDEREFRPPPLVDLPVGLSTKEVEQFLRELRISELGSRLRTGDLEIPDLAIRPPSPPPEYDSRGARLNSIEDRTLKSMHGEYSRVVYWMTRNVSGYVPPSDYRAPKFMKRVFLSDPTVLGLVIGPRGITLRRLEENSMCTFGIKGVGSKRDDRKQSAEEARMSLHVQITGTSEEQVARGVELLEPLIDPLHPDHEIERLKGLEQLAILSGATIRETLTDRQMRLWEGDGNFDEGEYEFANVVCRICRDRGHPTADCPTNKMQREQELAAWRGGEVTNSDLQPDFDDELKDLVNSVGGTVGIGRTQTVDRVSDPQDEKLAKLRPMIEAALVTRELQNTVNKKSNFHPLSYQASAVRRAGGPEKAETQKPENLHLPSKQTTPPWRLIRPTNQPIPESGFPPNFP